MGLDSVRWHGKFKGIAADIMRTVRRDQLSHRQMLEERDTQIYKHPRWKQMPEWVRQAVHGYMNGWEESWHSSGLILWKHWWAQGQTFINPSDMKVLHVSYSVEGAEPYVAAFNVLWSRGGYIDTNKSCHVWAGTNKIYGPEGQS